MTSDTIRHKYSTLLTAPTWVIDRGDHQFYPRLHAALLAFISDVGDSDTAGIDKAQLAYTIETHVRTMLTDCCQRLYMPAYTADLWASPRRLKAVLTPSIRSRLAFLDERDRVWSTVKRYFSPVLQDIPYRPLPGRIVTRYARLVQQIAWNFYLLVLASRNNCEVHFDPVKSSQVLAYLLSLPGLSQESMARLATIQGVFSLFSNNDSLPCFTCVPQTGNSFAERIDEIMEDAHLLEASALRRFLSIGANAASIKRDLRKLLQFIAKHSKWAKGALALATQVAFLPPRSKEVIDKLSACMPELASDATAPVIVVPSEKRLGLNFLVGDASKDVYTTKQSWIVMIRKVGPWGEPSGKGAADNTDAHGNGTPNKTPGHVR